MTTQESPKLPRGYPRSHLWITFRAWARSRRLRPLPASGEAILGFLDYLTEQGKTRSTLRSALAVIAKAHRENNLPWNPPKKFSQLLENSNAPSAHHANPLTDRAFRSMLETLPSDLRGTRDCAVLTLLRASRYRRTRLAALSVGDVQFNKEKLLLCGTTSITDEGARLALRLWLASADIDSGPLFRVISRYGTVLDRGLSGAAIGEIVKAAGARAGISARTEELRAVVPVDRTTVAED